MVGLQIDWDTLKSVGVGENALLSCCVGPVVSSQAESILDRLGSTDLHPVLGHDKFCP